MIYHHIIEVIAKRFSQAELPLFKAMTRLEKQSDGMRLQAMLDNHPTACDVKNSAQAVGHQISWIGYKLPIDAAE